MFIPNNQEMGAAEVSKLMGLHKSTVSRLMHVLTDRDFLQQNPRTKKYSLGRSSSEMGRAVNQSLDSHLITIAQPFIDALRNTIGETVAFELFSRNSTILACRARGPRLVQVSFNVGDRLPAHVAAGAKAVLAFLPPDRVKTLLPKKLESYTSNTITDRKVLLQQLREIKNQGIAFDRGERDIDVHVVAAPVFNYDSRPIAAVVIAVPVTRKELLVKSNIISQLKETSASISAQLFYSEQNE
jgi:DNA-binding IclR family transcriptional regulator